jgi:hypothetical protein
MIRKIRFRETLTCFTILNRAQTFRCPSPRNGEAVRSSRIRSRSLSSVNKDLGPRFFVGRIGASSDPVFLARSA